MGGLILDNIAVFLFWIVRQWMIDYRTRDWPTATATINRAESDDSLYPQATAYYSYVVENEVFHGQYKAHFWSHGSAYDFAIQMKRAHRFSVRYNPASPLESFVREYDSHFLLN